MLSKSRFYEELHHIEKLYEVMTHSDVDSHYEIKLALAHYINLFCEINQISSHYWRRVILDLLLYETQRCLYPLEKDDNYDIITIDNLYEKIQQYQGGNL